MTGFASKTLQLSNFSLQIDIKSVNHRFFDLSIKSPEELRNIEQQIRELISKNITRGKLDLRINIKESTNSTPKLNFNNEIFTQYDDLAKLIRKQSPHSKELSIAEIFNLPRVLNQDTFPVSEIQTILVAEIPNLITDLISSQHREGEKLKLQKSNFQF